MTKVDVEPVRLGLQRMQRLLSARRAWAALAAVASIDLAQQEMHVLLALGEGREQSMAELARLASMDAGAVSRQVHSLEKRGMVTRRGGPGRVVLLETTPEGRACARRVRAFYDRHLVDVLAAWEPDERDALGHLLVRLVDDLERTPYRTS